MEEAEPVVLDKEALKKLSPRERNLLKRRARMAAKDKSKDKYVLYIYIYCCYY